MLTCGDGVESTLRFAIYNFAIIMKYSIQFQTRNRSASGYARLFITRFAVQESASCNDALVFSTGSHGRSVCVSALAAPAGLELPSADVH